MPVNCNNMRRNRKYQLIVDAAFQQHTQKEIRALFRKNIYLKKTDH